MPIEINIDAKVRAVRDVVVEANPTQYNREAIGQMKPFLNDYTPYSSTNNASVEGVLRGLTTAAEVKK